MNDGGGEGARPAGGARSRSAWTDVALVAVVIGIIVAATVLRGGRRTGEGASVENGPASATRPEGRAGATPGGRDEVKRDLHNLATAEEAVFADSIRYVDDLSLLTRERGLILTSGATIRIVYAGGSGWAATAEGARLGGGSCVVRIGAVPGSVRPRTRMERREGEEAEVRCDGDR